MAVLLALLASLMCTSALAAFDKTGSFEDSDKMVLNFGLPLDEAWAKNKDNYTVYEKNDPDIRNAVKAIELGPNRQTVTLTFGQPLQKSGEYIVEVAGVTSDGTSIGDGRFVVKQSKSQVLIAIILGAMLINNFVFTKYLGLCIFFGVSQKKETAIGMGITFTLVMAISAVFCWAFYKYALVPFNLGFLKIIVFIGTVAIFVQAVDTVLRKVNPYLFKRLGVYLVLIVTNCIILAVPLINADSGYGPFESLAEGTGAGVGFAIALFLMACVREKLELCRVPASFVGLPIAFIVTGLFALAFLGFSGLSLF